MGANAATKCLTVLENTERVLAIELMNAAQALDLKRPLTTSSKLEDLITNYRKHVPFMAQDTIVHDLMKKSLEFVKNWH
jgi:histidine ammonia-lyase